MESKSLRINRKRKQIEKKDLKDCTFKPAINKNYRSKTPTNFISKKVPLKPYSDDSNVNSMASTQKSVPKLRKVPTFTCTLPPRQLTPKTSTPTRDIHYKDTKHRSYKLKAKFANGNIAEEFDLVELKL